MLFIRMGPRIDFPSETREALDVVLFMTVPTAGNRDALLQQLVNDSGLPADHIIIIATKEGVVTPPGTQCVEDLGEPNIQRWWSRGIEEAALRGATHVAVVNDDVSIDSRTLSELSQELHRTGAAIASPSRQPFKDGLHNGRLVPYEPRLWGSLWVLNLDSGLRPDTRYRWWYGDNDLDIRARKYHGGVVLKQVTFQHHHPGEGTGQSPELAALTQLDAITFETQYAQLLRRSRLLNRITFGLLVSKQ